jgi:hypothetical protein
MLRRRKCVDRYFYNITAGRQPAVSFQSSNARACTFGGKSA